MPKSILITKAPPYNKQSCLFFQEHKFIAISFPLIKILTNSINHFKLEEFNNLIFTSKNSVDIFYKKYLKILNQNNHKIWAIGIDTAKQIKQYHSNIKIIYPKQSNSENLFNLIKTNCTQKDKFLICKGLRGRNYLTRNLTFLGLKVENLILYERQAINYPKDDLIINKLKQKIDFITLYSCEIVINFFNFMNKIELDYHNSIFLVPSLRVANKVLTYNTNNYLINVNSANDRAFLSKINSLSLYDEYK